MDEIVDMCVGSLHLMARDPNNRIILRQLNAIPLIVQVSETFGIFTEKLISQFTLEIHCCVKR